KSAPNRQFPKARGLAVEAILANILLIHFGGNNMKKIIAMAALAAVSATASASANLFTDGSFEEISQVGSGQWAIVSQSTLSGDEGGHGWKIGTAPGV